MLDGIASRHVTAILIAPRRGHEFERIGSALRVAWGVVNGEAVAVRPAVADIQNSAADLSATVTKEGIVGTLAFVISAVNSMPVA